MNSNSDTLKIFQNRSFGKVRVVEGEDGEPWFVAKDVCESLSVAWKGVSGSLQHVPDEWRGVRSVQTPRGGPQNMWVLSEQGLYFFLSRSDKPGALPFQKWIAGEILPSIRKTGRYQVPAPALPPVALDAILERLVSIEQQITPLKEKASKYDAFLSTDGTCNLTQAAKVFSMTAISLGRLLRSEHLHWLFKRGERNADANMPTKEVIDQGYMIVRPVRSADNGRLYVQPRFTAAGLDALSRKMADLRRTLPALPPTQTASPYVHEAVFDCETVPRHQ